jgi:hypothetical protein
MSAVMWTRSGAFMITGLVGVAVGDPKKVGPDPWRYRAERSKIGRPLPENAALSSLSFQIRSMTVSPA